MKVIVYTTEGQGFQEGSSLEEALIHIKDGDNVLYLTCGGCLGGCVSSPLFNHSYCKLCSLFQKRRAKKYLGASSNIQSVNDYFGEDIKQLISNIKFRYSSIEEFKKLNYKSINIGLGALSTYISLTRNMEPQITYDIRTYLDRLLIEEICLIEIFNSVIKNFYPDLVIFHNGRFAQYRPILNIVRARGINYICTETLATKEGIAQKNYRFNTIPHDDVAACIAYENFWDSYEDKEQRESLAKSFFENRRYGKYAGDKIYIKDQVYGEVPIGWDNSKENIVIFNSSEDEFCAIDERVDNANMFGSQLNGIIEILDHYKEDNTKHFYLRVHPNLIGIPYDYHTILYKLPYKNITVIPASSKISTYSVLDLANKVIVFGSTMGAEASYWNKTVICLGYSFYSKLNTVYTPSTRNELWNLIDEKDLLPLPNADILKYGLFYISDKHERYKYIPNYMKDFKFLGKRYRSLSYATILKSASLYVIIMGLYKRLTYLCCEFKKIPR